MFAIILLFIGLVALVVLVFVTRVIVVLIVSMMIVGLSVITITLVASKIVTLLATILLVAQITAVRNGKMSHLFSFGCYLSLMIFSRMPATLSAA
jgi:hypothetical protein